MKVVDKEAIKDYKFFVQSLVINKFLQQFGETLENYDWNYKLTEKVCPFCSKKYININPNFNICEDCVKIYTYCFGCNTWHKNEDITVVGEVNYCKECIKDIKVVRCEICGKMEVESDIKTNVKGFSHVCTNCFMTKFKKCDVCGNYVLNKDIILCNSCNRSLCTDCYHSSDHMDCESTTYRIRSYHDNPKLKFRTYENENDNLYMGFELELELTNRDKAFKNIIGSKFIWGSTDSSITNGIEFITHPSTLKYYHNSDELNKFICNIKPFHNKEKPYQGLHVHIDRKPLNVKCYPTLRVLINKNEEFFTKFADRTSRYAQFDINGSIRDYIYSPTTLRGALNETKKGTIEIRMFKGIPELDFIYSALELCHSMCKFGNMFDIDNLFSSYNDGDIPKVILEKYLEYLFKNKDIYFNAINRINSLRIV